MPTTLAPTMRVTQVALDRIDPSPHNPRGAIAPETVRELADSIRELGQLVPLILRPAGDRFETIAGHRRVEALRVLERATANAVVVDEATDDTAIAMMIAENLHHLAPDPIAESRVVAEWSAEGRSEAEIAKLLGKSPSWIATRVALSKITPKVLAAAMNPKDKYQPRWSIAALEQLAKLPPERHADALARFHYGEVTAEDVRRYVADQTRKLGMAKWDMDDATLVPKAGACSSCPKTSARCGSLFFDEEREGGKASSLCLDRECWEAKLAALAKRNVAKLDDKGGKGLPVFADFRDGERIRDLAKTVGRPAMPQQSSLKKQSWCPVAKEAIVVAADGSAKVGTVYVPKAEPQAKPAKAKELTPKEKEKQRAAAARARAVREAAGDLVKLAAELRSPTAHQVITGFLAFGGMGYEGVLSGYAVVPRGAAKGLPKLVRTAIKRGTSDDLVQHAWKLVVEEAKAHLDHAMDEDLPELCEALAKLIGEDFDALVGLAEKRLEAADKAAAAAPEKGKGAKKATSRRLP